MRDYEIYWFLLLMGIVLVFVPVLGGMLVAYMVSATGIGYYVVVILVAVIIWLMISIMWWF